MFIVHTKIILEKELGSPVVLYEMVRAVNVVDFTDENCDNIHVRKHFLGLGVTVLSFWSFYTKIRASNFYFIAK